MEVAEKVHRLLNAGSDSEDAGRADRAASVSNYCGTTTVAPLFHQRDAALDGYDDESEFRSEPIKPVFSVSGGFKKRCVAASAASDQRKRADTDLRGNEGVPALAFEPVVIKSEKTDIDTVSTLIERLISDADVDPNEPVSRLLSREARGESTEPKNVVDDAIPRSSTASTEKDVNPLIANCLSSDVAVADAETQPVRDALAEVRRETSEMVQLPLDAYSRQQRSLELRNTDSRRKTRKSIRPAVNVDARREHFTDYDNDRRRLPRSKDDDDDDDDDASRLKSDRNLALRNSYRSSTSCDESSQSDQRSDGIFSREGSGTEERERFAAGKSERRVKCGEKRRTHYRMTDKYKRCRRSRARATSSARDASEANDSDTNSGDKLLSTPQERLEKLQIALTIATMRMRLEKIFAQCSKSSEGCMRSLKRSVLSDFDELIKPPFSKAHINKMTLLLQRQTNAAFSPEEFIIRVISNAFENGPLSKFIESDTFNAFLQSLRATCLYDYDETFVVSEILTADEEKLKQFASSRKPSDRDSYVKLFGGLGASVILRLINNFLADFTADKNVATAPGEAPISPSRDARDDDRLTDAFSRSLRGESVALESSAENDGEDLDEYCPGYVEYDDPTNGAASSRSSTHSTTNLTTRLTTNLDTGDGIGDARTPNVEGDFDQFNIDDILQSLSDEWDGENESATLDVN